MNDGHRRDALVYSRLLLDNVPAAMAYWDRDLVCRYANRAYERWLGVGTDGMIGAALLDVLGPALFSLNQPNIRAALEGEEQTFERTVPGRAGGHRHSVVSYLPHFADGAVVGFLAQVTEITRLRQLEDELRGVQRELESEVRRRLSAEAHAVDVERAVGATVAGVGTGFIATNRQGKVTHMNAVAEQMTGWSQSEAQGRVLWDVFSSDSLTPDDAARNPLDAILAIGRSAGNRVAMVSRDGRCSPMEIKVDLTRAVDESVRGLVLSFRDMTWLGRAEAEASRLAAIIDSSDDAIIGKTLDGVITSWNAAARAMFGYAADEVVGRSVQMLIPADRAAEEMKILGALATGRRVPAFDTLRRAKDGRLVEVSITISPIRDALGRIVGASKIVRDVSAQRRSAAALQRLEADNRQMQEASRLKNLFLANMSHELRTPLNAIIGFSDLLQSGAVAFDSPKQRTFLGHIGTSGRHLLQLINDVLDLSKVESGKFEFFPETVHLPPLVREVCDVLHAEAQRKRIPIVAEIAATAAELVVDPARLKQVLYNYLANALKFTPEGGHVTVRARAEGATRIRIEVEDTGIGIAAADLPRLFIEFQQIDSGMSRKHQGTGLGLALTRRLVEAQGGSVGVRSVPGQGSVFHVVLERNGSAVAVDAAAGEAPPAAPVQAMRILVIEGDARDQRRLVAALAGAGFQVETAATGIQARQQAQGTAYDAMTLDLGPADQRGLGVLDLMRSGGARRCPPVVGVTMNVPGDQPASFAVANVLSKPIRSDEIVWAMGRIRLPQQRRPTVMVIDDDPLALELMRATLAGIGIDAVCLLDGRLALHEIAQHRPDAIVLDLAMPEFDGFAVLDALQRMPAWRDTPVFIWTAMVLTDAEYEGLVRTARAILSKGGGALADMMDGLRRTSPACAGTSADAG